MAGHRRFSPKRSFESSPSRRRKRSNSCSSISASTTTDRDDNVHDGGHRRLKRSSPPLPVQRSPASSHHSCVLLNRYSARRDDFPGDSTTSAMSRTSRGEQISVSFVLVEPPDTSFLTADLPATASTTPTIMAAHRDVVLLAITSCYNKDTYPADIVVDLFVYQASRLPSLLLLPSAGRPEIQSYRIEIETRAGFGIMSCTGNHDHDDSPQFIIAYLEITKSAWNMTIDAHLFSSGSGQWEVFKNLNVDHPNGDHRDDLLHWSTHRRRDPLLYWSTDEVVQYGRRYMIFVDYYRGMVIIDLSSQLETATMAPRLQYVPLPVNWVASPVESEDDQRGCPKESRKLCVTRYGIKFVSVDRQHWSNFGIGNRHVLNWSKRFRITTWSLCEVDYTWTMDMRMHEEKFWDAVDGGDSRVGFPHVEPQFPVVDVDNPDVVVFQLKKPCAYRTKWMIEVDLRKKVLLAATDYSKKASDDAEDINFVGMKSGFDPIPSELPRYLDAGQICTKRQQ